MKYLPSFIVGLLSIILLVIIIVRPHNESKFLLVIFPESYTFTDINNTLKKLDAPIVDEGNFVNSYIIQAKEHGVSEKLYNMGFYKHIDMTYVRACTNIIRPYLNT